MTESSNTTRQGGPNLGGLLAIVSWIGIGAIALAAILLAIDVAVDLPFSRPVALGLGLALGGGLGGLVHLVRDEEQTEVSDETVTVASETPTPEPKPADLFEGHPDPVLYYADEGHGPVVRAVNPAFGDCFDVPTDRLDGAPLSDGLRVTGDETVDPEAVTDGGLDTVVQCETPDGDVTFRLRTVERDGVGYLLYTPRERD